METLPEAEDLGPVEDHAQIIEIPAPSLPGSESNLSIATLKTGPGSIRSTPRASMSLASPAAAKQHFKIDADQFELDYARRVSGETEDPRVLKDLLSKVLDIADRLSSGLATMHAQQEKLESTNRQLVQAQMDLETNLLLAKSNLTLERANNEMLEEALKREGTVKDIGWKRWSEREATTLMKRNATARSEARNGSQDGTKRRSTSVESQDRAAANSAATSPTVSQPPSTPPVPPDSGRFFKFRFGSGNRESVSTKVSPTAPGKSPISGTSTPTPAPVPVSSVPNHLTSASLPSLIPQTTSPAPSRPPTPPPTKSDLVSLQSELEALKKRLDAMQEAHNLLQSSHSTLETSHKTALEAKKALEEELESLSQALFEEANNMVADERKKRAAYEEELEVVRAEKEALKEALRVVEAENTVLREQTGPPTSDLNGAEDPGSVAAVDYEDASSVSSMQATKSRPSSPPPEPVKIVERVTDEDVLAQAAAQPRPKIPRTYTPVYI